MPTVAVLAVLSFASFRVTRFVVSDDLLDGARLRWLAWFPPRDEGPKPNVAGWRRRLGDLAVCPYCAGFWVTGLLLALAHVVGLACWPLRWDLVLWWAVAGGQALLNALDGKLW